MPTTQSTSTALAEGEIHVWLAGVGPALAAVAALRASLSTGELARAERFRFDHDRDRFVASHGALRAVLAHYTSLPAASLTFRTGAHGKPALSGRAERTGIEFNLSHSGELAAIAVTRGRSVGVDVECCRAEAVTPDVARAFMGPQELAEFESREGRGQLEWFFALWTRKEAVAKALGLGLSFAVQRIALPASPFTIDCPTPDGYVTARGATLAVPAPFACAFAVIGGSAGPIRLFQPHEAATLLPGPGPAPA